jgi:hypothetical protein
MGALGDDASEATVEKYHGAQVADRPVHFTLLRTKPKTSQSPEMTLSPRSIWGNQRSIGENILRKWRRIKLFQHELF